ncbi:MAG: transglycosylase domain-containing protein [Eubacterium sp.]|nr:transglycosylase domain-containing protein [Eubacterium sp.]
MASKDYDDLLQSFMNNSEKVYNEDKDIQRNSSKLPSSYDVSTPPRSAADAPKQKSSKKSKEKAKKKAKNSSPAKSFFAAFFKSVLAILMVIGVVGIVCVSVIGIYGYTYVHGDRVFDLDKEKYSQNQTSFIYGYGKKDKLVEITRLHGEENRIWLNKSDMTPQLMNAFISCEDKRFNEHHGVDWIRIGGVLKPNQVGQGGSTITQQLIKNLTDQNEVTFVRKFNEILSALNLEKHYSKDQIIEAYLNTIYLSHGCYGIKTAAETYFGKEAKDLNIAECAALASITKAPTKYDPMLNPQNNKSRRNWVIDQMYQNGYITAEEKEQAMNTELVLTNSKQYKKKNKKKTKTKNTKVNSYYTDYVIDEVIQDLQKMGYSQKKATNMIYGGGLKIYSAVDFDIQSEIEDVYKNYRNMGDKKVQGACVVMDYKGRVLGIVGGTGKKKKNRELNRAWQSKRQPGSTIKPVAVYGPAIQKSLEDENTNIYWSTPIKDAPLTEIDGEPWPTNDGGGYSGNTYTLQYGLCWSKNTISARTLDAIGPSYSYDFMVNRFHFSTLDHFDEDYAPLATGSLTRGVTVLEMTTAYQAFGNGGYYYEPYAYYKIEDSQGNVIIEKKPEETKEQALAENTAGIMNKLLQTVTTSGTGSSFKISNVECFGKTGTTSDNKDKWFIGGTPEYIAGVWYGYDLNDEIHYYMSSNPAGTVWETCLNGIYNIKGKNKHTFDTPEGVVQRQYNPSNGKLTRGSGMYGWYDENNLPGYSTYVAPTKESKFDKEQDVDEKETKNSKSKKKTTTKKAKTTEQPIED